MGSKILILFVAIAPCVLGISSAWRPIIPGHTATGILHHDSPLSIYDNAQSLYEPDRPQHLLPQEQDRCALYKVAMNQQLYFEYVQYKLDMPDMKEFTLCMWTKFHNHTNDHPLFSYAVGEQSRGILSWVANTARSSYYMMNIDGHNLYRLNYPLRLNKWYHSCQSWNGHTGEWQIWVNDERVGRGFNNRLVGHVIKGGGIAISGQEQRQLGGGFLEGEGAPPGSGGYLGELTMVQLYSVALSAGKAHKDHKHHHVHHYEHDTTNNTPRPTPRAPVTGPPLPPNPFLTGGQINTQVKINPGSTLQIVQNGVTLRHPAVPPLPPPRTFPPINPDAYSTAFPAGLQPSMPTTLQTVPQPLYQPDPNLQQLTGGGTAMGATASRFGYLDGPYRNLFKREKTLSKRQNVKDEQVVVDLESASSEKAIAKRESNNVPEEDEISDGKVTFVPREEDNDGKEKIHEKREAEKKKRGILHLSDGLLLNDPYAVPQGLDNDYFYTGLTSFGLQISKPADNNAEDEREPAEAEVKFVMDICDGCSEEPFAKALIMAWRSVPKKLYSGALHVPATQACKAF